MILHDITRLFENEVNEDCAAKPTSVLACSTVFA